MKVLVIYSYRMKRIRWDWERHYFKAKEQWIINKNIKMRELENGRDEVKNKKKKDRKLF